MQWRRTGSSVYRRNGRLLTADSTCNAPKHKDDVATRNNIETGNHQVHDATILNPKLNRMHITSSCHDMPRSSCSGRWKRNVLVFSMLVSLPAIILWIKQKDESIVHFECPRAVSKSMNHIPSDNVEYEHVVNHIKANMSGFMETFRNSTFDQWGRTYERVKEGMYHWKAKYFAANVENGDSIYESACGIGLNLYMTLEILKEVKEDIANLVVYGNDYMASSVDVVNAMYHDNPHATKGRFCPGDSADLHFVPSNAFDLVYTGYITPLNDPFHINKGSLDENLSYYKELCRSADWQSRKLSEVAQAMQEDFYAKWVGNMVRIAKPGKAVIVEQVSLPFCDESRDWGGVAREWWKTAIVKYNWDVDPSSLETEKDTIFRNRYHVFMRKNPPRQHTVIL